MLEQISIPPRSFWRALADLAAALPTAASAVVGAMADRVLEALAAAAAQPEARAAAAVMDL
jgi:hypothetical protein